MNTYLSTVNQKQFFAKLLLDKCLPATDPYGHADRALAESALYQLAAAYRAHLQAVAAAYQCANSADIADIGSLIAALQASNKHPAEAVEMDNLERDPNSWLALMLSAQQRLIEGDTGSRSVSIAKPGIALQDITEDREQGLSTARVRQWLMAFEEMSERHRAVMVEF